MLIDKGFLLTIDSFLSILRFIHQARVVQQQPHLFTRDYPLGLQNEAIELAFAELKSSLRSAITKVQAIKAGTQETILDCETHCYYTVISQPTVYENQIAERTSKLIHGLRTSYHRQQCRSEEYVLRQKILSRITDECQHLDEIDVHDVVTSPFYLDGQHALTGIFIARKTDGKDDLQNDTMSKSEDTTQKQCSPKTGLNIMAVISSRIIDNNSIAELSGNVFQAIMKNVGSQKLDGYPQLFGLVHLGMICTPDHVAGFEFYLFPSLRRDKSTWTTKLYAKIISVRAIAKLEACLKQMVRLKPVDNIEKAFKNALSHQPDANVSEASIEELIKAGYFVVLGKHTIAHRGEIYTRIDFMWNVKLKGNVTDIPHLYKYQSGFDMNYCVTRDVWYLAIFSNRLDGLNSDDLSCHAKFKLWSNFPHPEGVRISVMNFFTETKVIPNNVYIGLELPFLGTVQPLHPKHMYQLTFQLLWISLFGITHRALSKNNVVVLNDMACITEWHYFSVDYTIIQWSKLPKEYKELLTPRPLKGNILKAGETAKRKSSYNRIENDWEDLVELYESWDPTKVFQRRLTACDIILEVVSEARKGKLMRIQPKYGIYSSARFKQEESIILRRIEAEIEEIKHCIPLYTQSADILQSQPDCCDLVSQWSE